MLTTVPYKKLSVGCGNSAQASQFFCSSIRPTGTRPRIEHRKDFSESENTIDIAETKEIEQEAHECKVPQRMSVRKRNHNLVLCSALHRVDERVYGYEPTDRVQAGLL